jgi:ligand-binding SRPBCC domain-containing protein
MAIFTVHESITIHAPIERIFALSTRVELVQEILGMTMVSTGAPGNITSGSIVAGSRVTWHGWKFGLPTTHHTLITALVEPHVEPTGRVSAFFQDSQERGRFSFFQHDHHFDESPESAIGDPIIVLHDEVKFSLPFGPLGSLASKYLLAPYITALAQQRFARIKALAESDKPDGWRAWVPLD